MKIKTKKATEMLEMKKFGHRKSGRWLEQKTNIYYFNLYIPVNIKCWGKKVIFIRKCVGNTLSKMDLIAHHFLLAWGMEYSF